MLRSDQIIARLRKLGDHDIAVHSMRYFKTGRGEYGEGDKFLGIMVPVLRTCAREYREMPASEVFKLLKSPFHEARLIALFILVRSYTAAGSGAEKEAIYRGYLAHAGHINNWDLVDCSAGHIVGAHLFDRDRRPIYRLVRSENLWERRIGVMATSHFIAKGDFADTLAVAAMLLQDRQDLIHKAIGWMLREVGKRNRRVEEAFLAKHCRIMPRTMLRYAIEKFPEAKRRAYLLGKRRA